MNTANVQSTPRVILITLANSGSVLGSATTIISSRVANPKFKKSATKPPIFLPFKSIGSPATSSSLRTAYWRCVFCPPYPHVIHNMKFDLTVCERRMKKGSPLSVENSHSLASCGAGLLARRTGSIRQTGALPSNEKP